jgi:dynein heavy chain 1
MFSIFSRYNALFVRPHIRSAIREYQTTLIDRVKADIVSLQVTILDSKKKAMAVRVASNYDIPDFSANVMWLRQIEYQLNMNMKRIEDVLGEGWTNHLEGTGILFSHPFSISNLKSLIAGKELKKECDMLRQKLNTAQMFKEWSDKIISKCQETSDKLFAIEKQQRDGRVICQIRVNFSPDSIKISKEVCSMHL